MKKKNWRYTSVSYENYLKKKFTIKKLFCFSQTWIHLYCFNFKCNKDSVHILKFEFFTFTKCLIIRKIKNFGRKHTFVIPRTTVLFENKVSDFKTVKPSLRIELFSITDQS